MNKKILGGAITTGVIAVVIAVILSQTPTEVEKALIQKDEKLGLTIFPPTDTPNLSDLKEAYAQAATAGIGRNNVYLSWPMIEPTQGQYSWKISDALMSLNKQNDLKVSLYFSIINNRILGPFPNWMGKPDLDQDLQEKTVKVLDEILSRYNIVDYVIIGGEVDAYFRDHESDIPKYEEFFTGVYTKLKEKHPGIKFGNSFSLHGIINHKQEDLVGKLSQGDFVAFTYTPVNTLNEIDKSPENAATNLEKILDLSGGKKVGLMEISWSTAKSINGTDQGQIEFMKKVYDFYRKNESNFEFLTWYREYDRSIDSCMRGVNAEPGSINFGNEFVLKNTAEYICNAGLIDVDKRPKPAWEEFKKQIQFHPNS